MSATKHATRPILTYIINISLTDVSTEETPYVLKRNYFPVRYPVRSSVCYQKKVFLIVLHTAVQVMLGCRYQALSADGRWR